MSVDPVRAQSGAGAPPAAEPTEAVDPPHARRPWLVLLAVTVSWFTGVALVDQADEVTANLDEAAEKIRISKTLDLAASCSSDNSVATFAGGNNSLTSSATFNS